MKNTHERPVIVIDFGAQYAQLITRRVREARIYSELVPHTTLISQIIAMNPLAIILSGGPASVYEPNSPVVDKAIFETGIPIFGICYGFQLMAQALGGTVEKTGLREFGSTEAEVLNSGGCLLADLPNFLKVWMSHGDSVNVVPSNFNVTAKTAGAPIAAFENLNTKQAGVQFHPEVLHTEYGQKILERFLYEVAEIKPTWTPTAIKESLITNIRTQVGKDQVICGLSGGVDSAVAAALVQEAIGSQLTCVFVDHGLLREGEAKQVEEDYVQSTGIKLKVVNAAGNS